MSSPAIDALVEQLTREFERDVRGRGAAQILAAYAAAADDWGKFAHFSPACYTRNLIARTNVFEMLVLCWSPGQQSPIHDHASQRCWMAILDGTIEEVQYEMPRVPAKLVETGRKAFGRGKVAYVDDEIGLHAVRPSNGAAGVSLHLYSRPIDMCRIYDELSGAVLERTMLYHSVDGVPATR